MFPTILTVMTTMPKYTQMPSSTAILRMTIATQSSMKTLSIHSPGFMTAMVMVWAQGPKPKPVQHHYITSLKATTAMMPTQMYIRELGKSVTVSTMTVMEMSIAMQTVHATWSPLSHPPLSLDLMSSRLSGRGLR